MLKVNSSIKGLKCSARKLNLICKLISGMSVNAARNQLKFCKKRIAKSVADCLFSGISNAANNFDLDVDKLLVFSASVGRAKCLKRFKARARGRGARIIKHYSNLYLTLAVEV